MDIDEKLRAQSKLLLQKLKARQGALQQSLEVKGSSGMSSREESLLEATLTKSAQKNMQRNGYRSNRDKTVNLDSSTTAMKLDCSGREKMRPEVQNSFPKEKENKENINIHFDKEEMRSKDFEGKYQSVRNGTVYQDEEKEESTRRKKTFSEDSDTEYNHASFRESAQISDGQSPEFFERAKPRSRSNYREQSQKGCISKSPKSRSPKRKSEDRPRTPNTIAQRRKIIDKNVKVDSELNDSEIERLLDKSGLNYSYSNMDDTDCDFVRNRMQSPDVDIRVSDRDEAYADNLRHAGNDKKVARMIRESHKPKSILMNGSKSLKKASIE